MILGLLILLFGLGLGSLQIFVFEIGWFLHVLLGLIAAYCTLLGIAVLRSGPRHGTLPLPDGRMRYLDERSAASHAGGTKLSLARLVEFHPWLASGDERHREDRALFDSLVIPREDGLRRLQEHLARGDCRGAVVAAITDTTIIVAAYSDDFDACVFLVGGGDAARRLTARHRLQRGSRLITCNTFIPPHPGATLQADIIVGHRAGDSPWMGVWPMIVDFLTDDHQRLAELHAGISEDEWNRVAELAFAEYPDGLKVRLLEPFFSLHTGVVMPSQAS